MEEDTGVPDVGLGGRVRHARARRGWTREQLAVRAGMSWSGVAQIESGRRRNVRPDTLAALARTLDVTTDYLIQGGEASARMFAHRALLYDSDEGFVNEAGALIAESIERGDLTRVITSEARIESLRAFLGDRVDGTEFVNATDVYGKPDGVLAILRDFVDSAVRGRARWAHILGEPLAAGGFRANTARWARFESMLNLVFAPVPLTFTCAYGSDAPPSVLRIMRETHPETSSGNGSFAASPDYVDPGEYIPGRASARS